MKRNRSSIPHPMTAVTMLLGSALAVAILVASLLARTELAELNEEAVQVSETISELRAEQTELRADIAGQFSIAAAEEYAAGELGMTHPRADQLHYCDETPADVAAVLHIRRCAAPAELWAELVDRVGVCFYG